MAGAGLPITHDQFVQSFGKRNDLILSGWLGEDAGPERLRRLSEEKEARFRALVRAHGIEPLPGVRSGGAAPGRWLAAGDCHLRAQAESRDDGRRDTDAPLLRRRVAAEDVTRGKPDPEVFLVAALRLGAEPHRSIVVEDAPTGVEAGRRAGMRTVGVSLMHTLPVADVYVGTLPELPADTFDRLLASTSARGRTPS